MCYYLPMTCTNDDFNEGWKVKSDLKKKQVLVRIERNLEILYTVRENVKWCGQCRNQFDSLKKLKIDLKIISSVQLLSHVQLFETP